MIDVHGKSRGLPAQWDEDLLQHNIFLFDALVPDKIVPMDLPFVEQVITPELKFMEVPKLEEVLSFRLDLVEGLDDVQHLSAAGFSSRLELLVDSTTHFGHQLVGAFGAGGILGLRESVVELLVEACLAIRGSEVLVLDLRIPELPDPRFGNRRIIGRYGDGTENSTHPSFAIRSRLGQCAKLDLVLLLPLPAVAVAVPGASPGTGSASRRTSWSSSWGSSVVRRSTSASILSI